VGLGAKQEVFAENLAKLVLEAYRRGYKVRMGEVLRPPIMAKHYAKIGVGIKNSLHIYKLAGDLNLFKDGEYLQKTSDHAELGEYWESLHPLNRWGGRYKDGNHYEMTIKPWR
jgi:hypothetical protein